MSISLGELNEKVLDVLREQVNENDISIEEMIKCLSSVTAAMMSDAGVSSVSIPPYGLLTLEQ